MMGSGLGDARTAVLRRVRRWAPHLLLGLLAAEALAFVYYGNVNGDEGWYLQASRLVFRGEIPYRDFAYFQGPVLPYVYGLPQLLVGPSLLVGRLTSLAFTAGAVLTIVYLVHRLAGHAAVLWAFLLTLLNPPLMYYLTLVRSEALVTALSLLALAALFRFRTGIPALTVAPALLLLASGARIVFLPAFLAVTAFLWWTTPRTRAVQLLAGGLIGLQALVTFGIPFVLAPQQAVFGLWSSQASRANQWAPSDVSAGDTFLSKVGDLETLWVWYLIVLVPAVVLASNLVARYREGWRPQRPGFGSDPLSNYFLIIALAVLIFLPHMALKPIHPIYFVPSSALLIVSGAAAAVRAPGSLEAPASRSSFAALLAVLVLIGSPFYAARYTEFLDFRHPDLKELQETGRFLASYLDKDEPFLTFEPTLPLAADRPVMRGLEMGLFSYWPAFSADQAELFHVFNRELLAEETGRNGPRIVALTDCDLYYVIGPTAFPESPASPEDIPPFRLLPQLKEWYALAETVPNFGQCRANLYIFVHTAP